MSILENKIDFIALATVKNANGNGDPLNGNRPRVDYDNCGEIADVCVRRKFRNRLQDLGEKIFVQSDDRVDDGFTCLSNRASSVLDKVDTVAEKTKLACDTWFDVRAFGQVFAFKGKKSKKGKKGSEGADEENTGVSYRVRGPVSIHNAVSVDPVEVRSMQITKSVNGDEEEKDKKGSDTMGMKHFVRFGLYVIKGSINVQLAEKTGFSNEDADKLKKCLLTLFDNDASSARPEGSMEIRKVFWFNHGCKNGKYNSAIVHRSVKISRKDTTKLPSSFDDYEIEYIPLEGLIPEVFEN